MGFKKLGELTATTTQLATKLSDMENDIRAITFQKRTNNNGEKDVLDEGYQGEDTESFLSEGGTVHRKKCIGCKWLARKYTHNFSIHGLSYACQGASCLEKLFWALLLLAAITFSALLSYSFVQSALNQEVVSEYTVTEKKALPLPKVVICSSKIEISSGDLKGFYQWAECGSQNPANKTFCDLMEFHYAASGLKSLDVLGGKIDKSW